MRFNRTALLWALAALALHLAGNAHYGFFRDELYFIVCGRHPALGYVDQPPLAPFLAALSQSLGVSLFALRAVPAICAAVATYVACVIAGELEGGIFAQCVAGLVAIVAPEMMALGARLSPDMIELCTWPLIALWTLRLTRGADPRWWLAVGALAAVAVWSKYTAVFFVAALLAGMLVTPARRALRTWWFAGGAGLAVVLILPNFVWQVQNGYPMLQLLHNDYGKFLLTDPPFPLQQILIMNPALSIVWLTGLVWLLFRRATRFLGLGYIALIGVMWALDAKDYYPGPVYTYLIAAGAVMIERWTATHRVWRTATVAAILAFAIPSAPFVLPALPLKTFIAYQESLGRLFHLRFHTDRTAGNDVPIQYYADMTGWPELAAEVGRIYAELPPAQRAQAAILTRNAGEAAALDVYGKRYGLPPALSGNNNYWLWGPRHFTGNVLIDVHGSLPQERSRFDSVRLAATFRNRYAMPYENNVPIYVCLGIHRPLAALWPALQNYSYGFDRL
ncbi:MAG TPA: glycosyltransferase family 39 protein [Candidatus Rubrimentiphilum sp.]|nr:glycosyltransferase family 39 protein [Candidatus Rubrimentiphilum sp.]